MERPAPDTTENHDVEYSSKLRDRLLGLLDQVETRVENMRKDAARLEDEKTAIFSTLDTLRNNEMLKTLGEADQDDIFRYVDRLSGRCKTVDVSVTIARDPTQTEALHQVNSLIDQLVVDLANDPLVSRQRCTAYINACSSNSTGHSDKNFETAILGCALDDQKHVKKWLQSLLEYSDKVESLPTDPPS